MLSFPFLHPKLPTLSLLYPHPQFHPSKNPNKTLQFTPSSTTMSSPSSSWSCSKCTFLNPSSQTLTCQICFTPSSSSSSSSLPPLPPSSSSSPPKWSCKACTFLNSYTRSNCEICDTRAPSSLSTIHDLDSDDPGPDFSGSGSVGSIFFPLRKCNSGRIQESDDLGVKENGQIEMGSNRFDDPDVQLGGRLNSGSNKRKLDDLVSDSENGFGTGVKTTRANSGSVSTESIENTELKEVSGAIKILTYNVWFREDLEVYKRMQAIGELIQLHSPHIICLQEVTLNIYDILRSCSWWKNYSCSISYEKAAFGDYFCMQLAKLPVKSFSCKKFSYTIMGRELCVAEVELNQNKSLVVATSHLESPCPAPPNWDQMYSKERVKQAKETINFLKEHPNAIFCGDTNWDDKLDGQFPIVEGWFDAWERLRPADIGFTYDTKSNKMLTGNRKLQKRLDRFLCHLPDFEVRSIEIIGTEAIPGVTYIKKKKLKNKIQELTLPVLPSDHYGVLLTITNK